MLCVWFEDRYRGASGTGSLLSVHAQGLLQPKEPAGQAVYCIHVQGLLQSSQLDRLFTQCPCSGTGSLFSIYSVLQPKEPVGQKLNKTLKP